MMTKAQIIAVKKRKGNSLSVEFIKQFDEEWDTVIPAIVKSGADLSKIRIIEEPVNGR